VGPRRAAALLAVVLTALACAATALARTPAIRSKPAAARTPELSGVQSAQWKTWWGLQSYTGSSATLWSTVPTTPAETHSSLITTKRTWLNSTISVAATTQQQLRIGSTPNPWEVGWVLFRFQDLANYYWFMLKTNGFELGKKQGSDTQIFLVTGDLPAIAVGQSRQIEVRTQGPRIRVFVDGTKYVDYVDPHPLAAGSVGLYEEDSQVRFDSVVVS
jgi:hypothetical protein